MRNTRNVFFQPKEGSPGKDLEKDMEMRTDKKLLFLALSSLATAGQLSATKATPLSKAARRETGFWIIYMLPTHFSVR